MKPFSSNSLFACALLAFPGAATAQSEIKIPRPLPAMTDLKGPAVPTPRALPTAPARPGYERAPSKPIPADAPAVTQLVIERDRVHVQEPGDGRVWVRGADYKASFGAEGATFIPFLGSDAPQNYPVRFTLSSVRVGAHEIAFTSAGTVTRDGERIVIDRGAVDEVYDVTLESVEQTFVIESLAVRGALSVEVAVETELARRESGDGLEFANELGGMRYGKATVLDADGARFETASRLVDGKIKIDVPEAFVQKARLPLRVDPLFTTYTVANATLDEYYSDIAYDYSNNRWCVVYEEAYSSTDHDAYTVMVDANGVLIAGQGAYADFTTDFWAQPRVANNNIADNFLVVSSVFPVTLGQTIVKACTRAAASTAVGAQVTINGAETGDKFWADVGGDPHPSGPTYYMVVWQRNYGPGDTDVHARLVSSSGMPQGASVILLEDSAGTQDIIPRVSKSDGAPFASNQEWNIVWTRLDPTTSTGDIWGAQIHWDGNVSMPSFPITLGPDDDRNPAASSPLDRSIGLRPWMVVFERGAIGARDLMGYVYEGSNLVTGTNLSQNEVTGAGEDQINADVDSDGSQFMVVFRETYGLSLSDYDIFASAFWYADGVLSVSEGHMFLDLSFSDSLAPKICAAHSGGAPYVTFGATWNRPTSNNYDVYGAIMFAPYDVTERVYCTGDGSTFTCPCGNNGAAGRGCANSVTTSGAALGVSGSRHVSNDTAVLGATALPLGAPCLYFQGTAPAAISFGDGELCVGGTLVRMGVKFAVGSSANYPSGSSSISVAGGIPSIGGNRYYQVWYRDAAAFCTPSTFNLTNGLQVVWMP